MTNIMTKLRLESFVLLCVSTFCLLHLAGCSSVPSNNTHASFTAVKPLTSAASKPVLIAVAKPVANNTAPPVWIFQEAKDYPYQQYLTGVGSGQSRAHAEDAALRALSLTFNAQVKAVTDTREEFQDRTIRGENIFSSNIEMHQQTLISTEKILENVQFAEAWTDPKTREVHVLAIINRKTTGEIISNRIAEQDNDIKQLVNRSRSSKDKVIGIRQLRQAKSIALSRERNNADLRVINPQRSIPAPISTLDIDDYLYQQLQNLKLAIKVEGKYEQEIRAAIVEGLTQFGFAVKPGTSQQNADIIIQGQTQFENADLPQWKFVRWNIRLNLISQNTGKTFASVADQGREGHLNFKEAETKAVRAMQEGTVTLLGNKILDFIYGNNTVG